eukprot:NODE_520_length_7308_cov_0.176862.p3 type:complete len:234 gc:universal NODE_520_length_7308_cov_0.176862:3008-3709(+)
MRTLHNDCLFFTIGCFAIFNYPMISVFRRMASVGQNQLPKLPYAYDALEPVISKEIMEIHHTKHHQAYVTNLNNAEKSFEAAQAKGDITAQIALQSALKFNGGGHLNHSIFWTNLTPVASSKKPSSGKFVESINESFGSIDEMIKEFNKKAVAVQGSGWGWLGYNKQLKKLEIATTINQDPLEATTGLVPIFGVDVWEHAYYLQYKNARAKYLEEVWKVANWKDAESRFNNAQ